MEKLYLLENFIAVTETTSLRQAAHNLAIPQIKLQSNIHLIENLLGQNLIEIQGDVIIITPQGEKLIHYAKLLLSQVNDNNSVHKLSTASTENHSINIRLGMPTDYVSRYLDSFFLLFIKAFTNINLIIDTDVSGNLLARLNRGAFDIIIATHWLTLPNAEKLFDRHFYWVTALNGNAHQQQAIPIALYPENCPIRVQVFANHSLTMPALNIVLSTPSPTALCEAVELGIAVAPIAEFRINDKMQKINPQAYGLPELPVFNESIYVVDNNDCPHRELLKQLLKHHQQSLTVK